MNGNDFYYGPVFEMARQQFDLVTDRLTAQLVTDGATIGCAVS